MPPVFQLRQQVFSEGERSLGGRLRENTGIVAERHHTRDFGVIRAVTVVRWWGC
jgi:hypothetical protein